MSPKSSIVSFEAPSAESRCLAPSGPILLKPNLIIAMTLFLAKTLERCYAKMHPKELCCKFR